MEIAPGVHSLGQKQGGRVHAFLLDDGTGLTLIDTMYDADARHVLEAIGGLGRTPADLKRILLTHGHKSHLGGVATLKRLSGATVYAHEWEADIVAGERKAQGVTLRPMRPLRPYLPVYPLQIVLALGLPPGDHPPCPVDRPLQDGERVGPVVVVEAPGHSPGHVAFWWPAFNLNPAQQRVSLGRMAELDAAIVAVGHGEPITENAAAAVGKLATSAGR